MEEAEKLGKRVAKHLKAVETAIARTNRSYDDKARAARDAPREVATLEAERAEALAVIDDMFYPAISSAKAAEVAEAVDEVAEPAEAARRRSERMKEAWLDEQEERVRAGRYGERELTADMMAFAEQLISMNQWRDEQQAAAARTALREVAEVHVGQALNLFMWGQEEAMMEEIHADLTEAKAHMSTMHKLVDKIEQLDELQTAHAALTEQHDSLVDENYDLQMQVSKLQEQLKRAERGSGIAEALPAQAGVQDSLAGA
jgi:hypothetical protein